jgi:hypothetical protein
VRNPTTAQVKDVKSQIKTFIESNPKLFAPGSSLEMRYKAGKPTIGFKRTGVWPTINANIKGAKKHKLVFTISVVGDQVSFKERSAK